MSSVIRLQMSNKLKNNLPKSEERHRNLYSTAEISETEL